MLYNHQNLREAIPFQWVPSKTISLLIVTQKPQVRLDFVVYGLIWVFVIVENIDVSSDRFCSNDVLLVLGHISSPIYLTLVVDLNIHSNSGLFDIGNTATANSICIIIKYIFFVVLGVFG